jgi:uncharacterized LabA/DUF88 family protein
VNLLDPVLDTSDGGSSPRRRSLSESMIAGRRPARQDGAAAEKSEPTEPSSGRRQQRRKADDDEQKPAPARRRRRPAASRARSDEETPAAQEETEATEVDGTAAAIEEAMLESAAEVEAQAETPVEIPEPEALPSGAPPQDLQALSSEIGQLRALVAEQRSTMAEIRAGLLTLGRQVDRSGYRPRLGVFIDVPNLIYGFEDERTLNMGKLLDLLREGRQLIRATAYSPVSDDPREPLEQQKFVQPFVPYDYRIVTKPLKRFADGSIKGNFDVEMAIDMLSMADRVDVVAIVSGDADFARAVEAVQARGVRVEVVAFAGSTSLEMRALADHYLELSTVIDQIL